MDRRHGTQTSSHGKETGYLDMATGQVPTDVRGAWYLDKFPQTEDEVSVPGQVPMNRRRGTVLGQVPMENWRGTWTRSYGQKKLYQDKFP
jgi:hypothetical protein